MSEWRMCITLVKIRTACIVLIECVCRYVMLLFYVLAVRYTGCTLRVVLAELRELETRKFSYIVTDESNFGIHS